MFVPGGLAPNGNVEDGRFVFMVKPLKSNDYANPKRKTVKSWR
jgi:hypothetical protein